MEGVNSEAICDFLKELKKKGAEHHGLVIYRDGKMVFEHYGFPYDKNRPHTMYSVTKSIVATAIGFAVEEKLLSLDTLIEPYFSEYPHRKNKRWQEVTVKSLLTMHSGKFFSFLQDMTADYVGLFMKAPFMPVPKFLYSNNDAHVLSALLQKVTGQTVVDYLQPRLFEPLGIQKPFWETDLQGVCVGGTGLYLTTGDLAKIGQCYLDEGKFNGKQVIPAWWTKEVCVYRSDTLDKEAGYGYFFWLRKGGYLMDGMFGQFCMIFPQYNAVVAMTNCNESEDDVRNAFYHVFPAVFEREDNETGKQKLQVFLEEQITPIPKSEHSSLEKTAEKYIWGMKGAAQQVAELSGYPVSVLPCSLTATQPRRNKHSIDRLTFSFSEEECVLHWWEGKREITLRAGMDGNPRETSFSLTEYPYSVWAYAYWKGKEFHVVFRVFNTLSSQHFVFRFFDKVVRLTYSARPKLSKFCSENAVSGGAVPSGIPLVTPLICSNIEGFAKMFELPVMFFAQGEK